MLDRRIRREIETAYRRHIASGEPLYDVRDIRIERELDRRDYRFSIYLQNGLSFHFRISEHELGYAEEELVLRHGVPFFRAIEDAVRRRFIREVHFRTDINQPFFVDQSGNDRHMTATEVRARQQQMYDRERDAMRRYERAVAEAMMRPLMHYCSTGDFLPGEVGNYYIGAPAENAENRSMELLLENLSPKQREQYEKYKYFKVKGERTGKTYAITKGSAYNVIELRSGWFDDKRLPKRRLCFQPIGAPWTGDVMLTQKIALENFEREAIRVANRASMEPHEQGRVFED